MLIKKTTHIRHAVHILFDIVPYILYLELIIWSDNNHKGQKVYLKKILIYIYIYIYFMKTIFTILYVSAGSLGSIYHEKELSLELLQLMMFPDGIQ